MNYIRRDRFIKDVILILKRCYIAVFHGYVA